MMKVRDPVRGSNGLGPGIWPVGVLAKLKPDPVLGFSHCGPVTRLAQSNTRNNQTDIKNSVY